MPFGKYANFRDCVKKNKGKVENPEAYCASIERTIKERRERKEKRE